MVPLTPHPSPPTTLNLQYGPNLSGTGPTSPTAAAASGTKRFPTAPTSLVGPQESLASGPQRDSAGLSGTPLSVVNTLEDAGSLFTQGQWAKCINWVSLQAF